MILSRIALILGVVALLLMPAAGLAYRLDAVSLKIAFTGFRWAAYLGIAAMLAAIIGAAISRRQHSRRGMILAGVGLLLGMTAFAVPFQWQRTARAVPPIHDITTDVTNPPTFEAVVALRANAKNSLDYSATVGEQQREAYPDIVPLTVAAPPANVFEKALAIARDAGWEIVSADPKAGRIEATDTTFWFGFKDDVVIRLSPDGTGTRVDVRSVSRVGRSDVGANARRIRRFLQELQAS